MSSGSENELSYCLSVQVFEDGESFFFKISSLYGQVLGTDVGTSLDGSWQELWCEPEHIIKVNFADIDNIAYMLIRKPALLEQILEEIASLPNLQSVTLNIPCHLPAAGRWRRILRSFLFHPSFSASENQKDSMRVKTSAFVILVERDGAPAVQVHCKDGSEMYEERFVVANQGKGWETWLDDFLRELLQHKSLTHLDLGSLCLADTFLVVCSSSSLQSLILLPNSVWQVPAGSFETASLAKALTLTPPPTSSNGKRKRKRGQTGRLCQLTRLVLDVLVIKQDLSAICQALQTNSVLRILILKKIPPDFFQTPELVDGNYNHWDPILQMLKCNTALTHLELAVAEQGNSENIPVISAATVSHVHEQLYSVLRDHNRSIVYVDFGLCTEHPPNIQERLHLNYFGFGSILGGEQTVTKEDFGKTLLAAQEKEKVGCRPLVPSLFRILQNNPLLVNFFVGVPATSS